MEFFGSKDFLFQQEITYNVADSPITYGMYVAPGYSLGFNRVVYSPKNKIIKVGLQYSRISFSDHIKDNSGLLIIGCQKNWG